MYLIFAPFVVVEIFKTFGATGACFVVCSDLFQAYLVYAEGGHLAGSLESFRRELVTRRTNCRIEGLG